MSQNQDGSATIECLDGSTATVAGEAGAGCTAEDNEDGTFTLTCGDSAPVIVSDGAGGTSCSVADNGDGTSTITCEDGTTAVVSDGAEGVAGTSCTAADNGDGTSTLTCPDGTSIDYTTCSGVEASFSNFTMNGASGDLTGADALVAYESVDVTFDYDLSAAGRCSGCSPKALVAFYDADLGYMVDSDCVSLNAAPSTCEDGGAVTGSTARAGVALPGTPGTYEARLVHVSGGSCDAMRDKLSLLGTTSVGTSMATVEVKAGVCAAGRVLIDDVKFDGQSARKVQVAPGESVTLSADFTNVKSSCSGCVEYVRVGFQAQPFGCLGGSASTCPGTLRNDETFTFTAPDEPGSYPIFYRRGLVFNCEDVALQFTGLNSKFAVVEVTAP